MITAGILMAVTVGAALVAVTVRNVLHAIFGLAVALFGVAGLFLTLNSPFVAAMEILIYVGGISVAMIFAVMLSTVIVRKPDGAGRQLLAALAALALFGAVGLAIARTPLGPESAASEAAWSLEVIGASLLTHYNVVFEILSLVLLVAIVGAIAISRKEHVRPDAVGVVALTETVDPELDVRASDDADADKGEPS
jgi:NADH:ubiquinone oxidoreductase subunit 6 (subunit J)